MDHTAAKAIFHEIQARPFSVPLSPDETAWNCYFKGIELLQRLGILGYAVRGRVGETFWDPEVVPAEAVALLPDDLLVTHFFVEAMIDGAWRILDTTMQPELQRFGFTIGSWDDGQSCFPITKLYTQEESLAYQAQWADPAYQRDFCERGKPCWKALKAWFAKIERGEI